MSVLNYAKWVDMGSKDLSGQRFGSLTVIEPAGFRLVGKVRQVNRLLYRCMCDCGVETNVIANNLARGGSLSCKACSRARAGLSRRTHGRNGSDPTYGTWSAMRGRCSNPENNHFDNYGARGITVCDRWLVFENFLEDMGERPVGMTLDRRDNNGNYEPSNCRWATPSEQSRNTRQNRYLEVGGKKMIITDWAAQAGITQEALNKRLKRGWSVEDAVAK